MTGLFPVKGGNTMIRNPFLMLDIQRFAAGSVVNATTQYVNADTGVADAFDSAHTLSPTMKEFYDTSLLENAREEHYYAQFGSKQPLPRNKGRTIEWRKWNTLPNAGKLTEGVIPSGEKLGMTYLTGAIEQYGLFVAISDLLELHAVDNVLLGASEELGASAGNTQDILVRNELMTGTNVIYADTMSVGASTGVPKGRYQMAAGNNKLTGLVVNRAATWLKKQKAPMIDGSYVAIIHPSQAFDLRRDPEWLEAHKYARPDEIFNGEIGKLHGVRFIETNNTKVFVGGNLDGANISIALTGYTGSDTTASCTNGVTSAYKGTVSTLSADVAAALVGRQVHFYDASATAMVGTGEICGTETGYIWFKAAPPVTLASGDTLWPGEGGDSKTANGPVAVYGALFFGRDAWGSIDPDGGGLEMIVKDKSQIGGPLNQFSTAGYKLETGCKILYPERMVRVECCSDYSTVDEGN